MAGDLRAGESIVTLNGTTSTVVWVHTVPGQADMYNLTVANDHTYAVGDGQVVVHNEGVCGENYPQLADARAKEIFNKVQKGWWSRKELTVSTAYFQEGDTAVRYVTFNESALEKYGPDVIREVEARGDRWAPPIQSASGDAHAEATFRQLSRTLGSQPLGVGASKYICGACFDAMTQDEGWPTGVLGTPSPQRDFYPPWYAPGT